MVPGPSGATSRICPWRSRAIPDWYAQGRHLAPRLLLPSHRSRPPGRSSNLVGLCPYRGWFWACRATGSGHEDVLVDIVFLRTGLSAIRYATMGRSS